MRKEEFLDLNYSMEVTKTEEGFYFIKVPDLQGCMSEGDTMEEAHANIEEAKLLWYELAMEDGDEIPLPSDYNSCSGRILLRVPKSLHAELLSNAKKDGVSLNQHIVHQLANKTGMRKGVEIMTGPVKKSSKYKPKKKNDYVCE